MAGSGEQVQCQACRHIGHPQTMEDISTVDIDLDSILSPGPHWQCHDHAACLARVRANRESAWEPARLSAVVYLPDPPAPGNVCVVSPDERYIHEYAQDVGGVVVEWPVVADYRPQHRRVVA